MSTNANKYVYLSIGHRVFPSGYHAVVNISDPRDGVLLTEYRDAAKIKLCKNLNISASEVVILDWSYLGSHFRFIED